MRNRLLLVSVVAVTALVGLAGCSGSVSIGEKKVSTDELEKQVSALVGDQLGSEPSAVDCPDQLKGEVDATTLCTVTVDGTDGTVKLVVTEVDGGQVKFDVTEVNDDGSPLDTTPDTSAAPDDTTLTTSADEVPTVAPAELERQVNAELEAQFGAAPDDLTCPDPLEGTVGATTTCVLTDGTETYDVLLTARAVDGFDVNFDFQVADTPN